jgi:ABC-2 type transport system ATP-binding protein
MDSATHAVAARALGYAYPSGRRGVAGIDLVVRPGERVLILGPNGSGKSTLIQLLAGVLEPAEGSLSVVGGASSIESGARRATGVALDRVVHWEPLTTLENLVLLARASGMSKGDAGREGAALLGRFGVDARLPVRECSLGMKRKLLLAQALVHAPRLLLLDEPTLGLDPDGIDVLGDLLRERTDTGAAAVVASNDVRAAPLLGTRVVFLLNGQVVADQPVASLLSALEARTRFDVTVKDGGTPPAALIARGAPPGGLSLEARDHRIVAQSHQGAAALPEFLRWLLSEGAGIQDVRVREPDLSDVFHHLTGRTLEEGK